MREQKPWGSRGSSLWRLEYKDERRLEGKTSSSHKVCPKEQVSRRYPWPSFLFSCAPVRPCWTLFPRCDCCSRAPYLLMCMSVSMYVREKESLSWSIFVETKELIVWKACWVVVMVFPAGNQFYQTHGHIWTVSPGVENRGPCPSLENFTVGSVSERGAGDHKGTSPAWVSSNAWMVPSEMGVFALLK